MQLFLFLGFCTKSTWLTVSTTLVYYPEPAGWTLFIGEILDRTFSKLSKYAIKS